MRNRNVYNYFYEFIRRYVARCNSLVYVLSRMMCDTIMMAHAKYMGHVCRWNLFVGVTVVVYIHTFGMSVLMYGFINFRGT